MADQRINQSEQADLATTNLAETTNQQRTGQCSSRKSELGKN